MAARHTFPTEKKPTEWLFPVNTLPSSLGYWMEATDAASLFGTRFRQNLLRHPLGLQPSDYDALLGPIQDRMMRSIWRITRVAEDADDALQESLTIIWKHRARIERHPRPQALVLRICVNCACDVLRARLRRSSRETALVEPEAIRAKNNPVDQQLHEQELRDDVARALARLPRRQATAVLMRYLLELPYQEIGDALGCSEATARVHVNRAHQKLKRLLAHWVPSHETGGTV